MVLLPVAEADAPATPAAATAPPAAAATSPAAAATPLPPVGCVGRLMPPAAPIVLPTASVAEAARCMLARRTEAVLVCAPPPLPPAEPATPVPPALPFVNSLSETPHGAPPSPAAPSPHENLSPYATAAAAGGGAAARGELLGILTATDVARRVIAKELSAETTTVAAAMTAAPTTVHEREDAAEAIAKMAAGGFRHVPVLRSGGGLALLDVARCLYDAMTLLEDASAGGALLDAVARRCGRAPAVPPRASVVDAARALAAAPAALLLGGDGAPAALVTPRALLNVAATGGVGWFRTTRAAAVATEALPPRAPPRASVADACHVMQEQRTAHVLVAVAADDGGSPAALPPLPLLLSSVQLLAEAIEHARRAAAVRANIAKAEAARAEAAARAAETAGKAAAKAALAERATAVAACLVTTAFVGGAVALLRKR